MSENKHISIPKNIESEDQNDFHFLRRTGIRYIEQVGGKLWTDYNSHDPGITTLEVLSYAITDLGMRMNLDIEDILASKETNKGIDKQFFKATEVLPSSPLTELDYRKLFIDISVNNKRPIRNCWLFPRNEKLYVDCESGDISFEPVDEKTRNFTVKGLYDLYVDYADGVEEDEDCGTSNVNARIFNVYQANRNLCEDLVEIKAIETQEVSVCTKIGLDSKADEELVHAKILMAINNYLSPDVNFYSLKQMLDKGLSTDEIFEGPLLNNGFIDTDELRNSHLRKEVRLSDLIKEIMKVDGVKEIFEISISGCDTIKKLNDWVICIENGKKPELCEASSFSYSKGNLPVNISEKKVQKYLELLKVEKELLLEEAKDNKELQLPQGNAYDLANYASIMNEFPDTYGVGLFGIIGSSSPEREALAKQMKGYLLFFDQILASYFKHLENVKDILSINGSLKRTYFTQAIKDIKGLDELVNNYSTTNDDELTDTLYEELDNNVERRNQILDHLLSRFAETFGDYAFLMKTLYGNSADEIILSNKQSFLNEYQSLSKNRGLAYNYSLFGQSDIWDTDNISGVEKRIARLLGIKNYTRRNLSDSSVIICESSQQGVPNFKWKLKDNSNGIILSSEGNDFKTEYVATQNLHEAIYQIIQVDEEDLKNILESLSGCENNTCTVGNMKIRFSGGGNYYFEVLDDEGDIIANHRKTNPYSTFDDLKDAILKTVKYLKYSYSDEGILLVEHLILKPKAHNYENFTGIGCMSIDETFTVDYDYEINSLNIENTNQSEDTFMKSCEEDCETDVYDPYSYRVSVVLPGFTYRFQNPDFRRFAETVIRQEIPAHILAKVCWVGDRYSQTAKSDLSEFEKAYKKFLQAKATNDLEKLPSSTSCLLDALTNLNNIYPPGRLLDCDSEDNDKLDGRIILGQSNI